MGLDMYLNKKTYVQKWKHAPKEKQFSVSVKRGGKSLKSIKNADITYVEEQVAYWRKANQIHNWFINNCADGDENRSTMYVSEEQLQDLLNLCEDVLSKAKLVKGKIKNGERLNTETRQFEPIMEDGSYIENKEEIEELLPTTSGFFFGSTDYDEYYIQDIKETIKQLEAILENAKVAKEEGLYPSYTYEASW